MVTKPGAIRRMVGVSKARAAKLARCSIPLITLYEANV